MTVIIFAVVLGFLVWVVIATIARKKERPRQVDIWPFFAKKVLSVPEQILYFRLIEALPNQVVLAQVQLSRILGIKKGENVQAWNNRINRMSVDFVVCAKDATVRAVIELDDQTHDQADRKASDQKKDKALGDAGIKVLRWRVKALPDAEAIRSALGASKTESCSESKD